MVEIIGTLAVLFFVWFIGAMYGWRAREHHIHRSIRSTLSELEQEVQKTHIRIKIEKHRDTLYAYDAFTQKFMAQGKNRYELEKDLQTKFPGKRFAAEPADIYLLGAE